MTASHDDRTTDVPSGYHLRQRLGQGAFGEVWSAEAPGGVEVAMKVIGRTLRPAEAQREFEALQLMRRLRHQNLLALQAFFSERERLFIVLELADCNLRQRLGECQDAGWDGIPPSELLGYCRETAEALDYLHANSVQHRDVKPDNLLLLGRHVKVADFGLARMLEEHGLQTATSMGTPAYMAPEICEGKISLHSDQYSLAITYAELRLGQPPFPARNPLQWLHCHLNLQPALEGVGERERRVLLRALAKSPDERFPDCSQFAHALMEAVAADARESGPSPHGPGTANTFDRPDVLGESMATVIDAAPAAKPGAEAPRARRWKRSVLVVGVLVAAAGGLLAWKAVIPPVAPPTPKPPLPVEVKTLPDLELLPIAGVMIQPRQFRMISVRIVRRRCPHPVELRLEGIPEGVTVAYCPRIPPDKDNGAVGIEAGKDTAPRPAKVRLVAVAGDLQAAITLQLTVQPPGSKEARLALEDQTVKETPRDPVAYLNRGGTYIDAEEYERAVEDFRLALNLGPQDALAAIAHKGLAIAYHRMKDKRYDQAIEHYATAVKLAPELARGLATKHAFAHSARGNTFFAKEQFHEAIADYREAERLDAGCTAPLVTKFAVAYHRLGDDSFKKGERGEALAHYTKAIHYGEKGALKDPSVYRKRGDAYFATKEYGKAVADYTRAIHLGLSDAAIHSKRGDAYQMQGEHDRAIADYDKAIGLDEKNPASFRGRGRSHYEKKDYDRAIADYDKAIGLNEKNPAAYLYRGRSHYQKKDYDRAIADYDKAIGLNPAYDLAYNDRGAASSAKEQYGEAIEDYTKAINLGLKGPQTYCNRGVAHSAKKQYREAIEDYTKAINLGMKDPRVYNNRGVAYSGKEQYNQAIEDFTEAIRLNSNYATAYSNRAAARQANGDVAGANDDHKQAAALRVAGKQ